MTKYRCLVTNGMCSVTSCPVTRDRCLVTKDNYLVTVNSLEIGFPVTYERLSDRLEGDFTDTLIGISSNSILS